MAEDLSAEPASGLSLGGDCVGRCRLKRVKVAGDERYYHDTTGKNPYSHVHDALQYALSGGGEGLVLLRRADRAQMSQPAMAEADWNIWQQAS